MIAQKNIKMFYKNFIFSSNNFNEHKYGRIHKKGEKF
jgi:hypothetical protein